MAANKQVYRDLYFKRDHGLAIYVIIGYNIM